MNTFGIRLVDFASSNDHYVSQDARLFDWLLANNYGPSDRDSWYSVPAPEGYVFWNDNVIAENSPKLQNVNESELSKSSTVTSGSSENDKALMLLEEAMSYVKSSTFYAQGIDEDRILDYLIY